MNSYPPPLPCSPHSHLKEDCNKLSRFHLWIPSLYQMKGGIQVYSAFLLEALQNIYPDATCDVFLKHDTDADFDLSQPNMRLHGTGNWSGKSRTLAFASQIFSSAIAQRPDLIISTHLNFIVVAYWLKKMAGIPYWSVAHGIEAWDVQNPALKRALLGADKILAVSNYTRDRLIQEQNLDPDRVVILPNTFDAARFKIAPKPDYLQQRYDLNSQQPTILTLARLDSGERYKGYDKILQALPQVLQEIPQVRYILAGKGEDAERVKQLIKELKLEDCVTLTGFVCDPELSDLYNLCDLFAMPSQGEGFGIVYLEALASGKPTLAGNKDGSVDALNKGELGVLVDPNNVSEIARSIVDILQGSYPHPMLYQPELLRQNVESQFGLARFQATLASHFQLPRAIEKCAV
jgi:glycosyltransferase involved in cell wall biosynthesis